MGTMVSIVFTLSFCLDLVSGKNLPYKRSRPVVSKTFLAEAEDTEDRNGKPSMNGADYTNGSGDSYSYSHSWGKNHGNGNGNGKSGDSHSHSWGKNHGNGNGNGK